jgi:hypothetical protein
MSLNLTQFTPGTTVKSAEANANNQAIQTLINNIRPTIYIPVNGTLTKTLNVRRNIRIRQPLTMDTIYLDVVTPPTGQALKIDVRKNGASIFQTKPSIAAGATSGGTDAVFAETALAVNDVLSFDIDQIGTDTPGADLMIALAMRY